MWVDGWRDGGMDGWIFWMMGGVEVERGILEVEVEGERERGRLTSSNDRHYRWE